jgi:hypothetical protein
LSLLVGLDGLDIEAGQLTLPRHFLCFTLFQLLFPALLGLDLS